MPQRRELRAYQVMSRGSSQAVMPHDPLVAKAVQWLEKSYAKKDPWMALYDHADVAANTLCRRFKADIGITPQALLQRLRIDHACELLRDTDLPMEQIAQLCGFAGNTPFGVAFRRQRNCSPTVYRKQLT